MIINSPNNYGLAAEYLTSLVLQIYLASFFLRKVSPIFVFHFVSMARLP